MTPEEIEKAAVEYADSTGVQSGYWNDIREGFLKGEIFVNEKWQEKTRWIPLDERLPKVRPKDYQILGIKGETCFSYWICDSFDVDELKKMADSWREVL